MSVQEDKNPSGEPKPWLLVVILLAVIAILALNGWWLHGDANGRGTFGDMFGGVNALFSGAAFSVLAFTLLLQRYELKLQREELAETRKVMEAQREQMELQAKTQQLQQFENTFFQLIKVHGDIVRSMEVPYGGATRKAQGAMNAFAEMYKAKYSEMGSTGDEHSQIREAFSRMYSVHESQLGPYFRHLYHIIKFVDESPHVDQMRYRAFLRAQLSTQELTLMFYNCLTVHGENTKPLVERYRMLKHLPLHILLKPGHADLYDKMAFLPA